jgi:arylsulfatase A
MLWDLDLAVGRLLNGLDELEIAENTYVVFMSDNGCYAQVPGADSRRKSTNHPLTGAKHSLNEGGLRVPFFVRGPGVPQGSINHTPVIGYDLLPTFYELGGGQGDAFPEVDGISLAQLFQNADAALPERTAGGLVFHRPKKGTSAIRTGDYKLILNWKAWGKPGPVELYKVNSNPREKGNDLASQDPERSAAMQQLLTDYLQLVDAEQSGEVWSPEEE